MPRFTHRFPTALKLCAALIVGCTLAVVFVAPGIATAQAPAAGQAADAAPQPGDWPKNLDQLTTYVLTPEKFVRGPGGYFSPVSIALCWLVVLGWVATSDWVNQDGQRTKGSYRLWNQVVVFAMLGALVLAWLVDVSISLTLPMLLIAWLAPLGAYIWIRNKTAHDSDKVLTPEHLRHWAAPRLAKIGIKISTVPRADRNKQGPPIELHGRGAASDAENQANTLQAKHHAGFPKLGELLIEALQQRVGAIMFDFTREATTVRFQIDGVWNDMASAIESKGTGCSNA